MAAPDLSPAGEIAAVMAAPGAFLLAVVAVGAVMWFIIWRIYEGRIATLEERIRLRDEQLAAVKDKLNNAPSDQAAVIGAKAELAKQERLAAKQADAEAPIYLTNDDGIVGDSFARRLQDRLDQNRLDTIAPRPHGPRERDPRGS